MQDKGPLQIKEPDPKTQPIIFYQNLGTSESLRCACAKSRCLRLHCSCFVKGRLCGSECQCLGCLNNVNHEQERSFVMHYTAKIRSDVFQPMFVQLGDERFVINKRGCKCSRSKCQNRHCECFKNGVPCGPKCVCTDCSIKNKEITTEHLPLGMDTEDKSTEKYRLIIPKMTEAEMINGPRESKISVVRSKKRKQTTHNYNRDHLI